MELQPTDKTPIESSQDSFDVAFYKKTEEFSSKIIEAIPELQGVAVIPLWSKQPEHTPPGLLRLRNPEPPYLAALLQLLGRTAAFNVELHRDFVSQIQVFDGYAADLANRIKNYTDELKQLQDAAAANSPAPANE